MTATEAIASTEVLADQMPLKEPSLPASPDEAQERPSAARANQGVGNWLSDLRESVAEDTYEPTTGNNDNGEVVNLPDWLSGGDTSAPDVTFRGPAPAGEAVFDGLIPEDGELPDWLQEVRPSPETTPPAEESTGTFGSPANAEESTGEETTGIEKVPPWIPEAATEGRSDQESAIAQEQGEQDEKTGDTIPEWLREAAHQEKVTTGSNDSDDTRRPAPGDAGQGAELPDWLAPVQQGTATPPAESPTLNLPSANKQRDVPDLPGWLQEIIPGESPGEAVGSSDQVQVSATVSTPTDLSPQANLEPPVLQAGHEPPSENAPEATNLPSADRSKVTGPADVGVPDWLREMVASAQVGSGSFAAQDETAVSASSHPRSATMPAQEETERIAPVQDPELAASDTLGGQTAIPDWIEALKPASQPSRAIIEEERIETGGVLDGLHDVLPAVPAEKILSPEDSGPTSTEPPEPSVARAQLLQALLARTPQMTTGPSAKSHRGGNTGLWLQRMLVTVVMISAVVGTLLLPLLIRPVPDFVGRTTTLPGADSASRLIETLGPEDTVLVAFEYGPAEADELNLLAAAILHQLTDRNVRVQVVSTRPEGPAIAAAVLDSISSVERSGQQFEPGVYRPGGAVAVSDLLHSSADKPAAVVILTANPAVLRRWVEQTQLLGSDLPVVAGVSAGLAPVIRPYFDGSTDRLVGAIGGLAGAAYYEQVLLGFNGPAAQRLNALAAGHYAAIALIIVGAIAYGVSGTRRKTE